MTGVQSPATGVKVCRSCGVAKAVEEFHRRRDAGDGRRTQCKECRSEYKHRAYERDRVRVLAHQKAYRLAHREERSRANLAWQRANPERYKETTARFRERHRERLRDYHREWSRRHPDAQVENVQRRRARLKGATVERVDLAAVLERDREMCYLCGEAITRDTLSFDHVIPVSRGGAHSAENLRAVHRSCNSRKGAKLVDEL